MLRLYPKLCYKKTFFKFESVASQRLNPHNQHAILLGSSFVENETYFAFMMAFTMRPILYVSEGKQNGQFAPLKRLYSTSTYRSHWILDYTHIKFSFDFTPKPPKGQKPTKEKITAFPALIIDLDNFDGDLGIFDRYNLRPNYFILNPIKPKSLQVGYVLDQPVFKDKEASFEEYCRFDKVNERLPLSKQPEPYQFYTIFKKLTSLFGGDEHFNLHIAKNPFAATKVGSICWTDIKPYSIRELVARCEDIIATKEHNDHFVHINFEDIRNHIETETDKHKNYQKDQNSRNCQLFDELRTIAYEVADLYEKKSASEFSRYLLNIAKSKNQEFTTPLPFREITAMIRSIVKFCLRKKVTSKYPSYQKRRLEKMSQVKSYMIDKYGPNHRYNRAEKADIASRFDVSEKSITVYASQIRKEHGTLKDERTKLLQEIHTLRNATPPFKWARIAEMLKITEDNAKVMYKRYIKSQNEVNNGN